MKQALWIWAAGAAVRLILAFGLGRVDTGWTEVQLIGRSLLERGEFADPYAIPTGPTSHTGPVYPAIQALIFAVAGYGVEAERLRIALTILLASLEYALMPWVASRLGLGTWVGAVAGWSGALVPLHYWGESMGVFENTLVALLLALTGWAGPLLTGEQRASLRRAAAMGAFAGIVLLVSPSVALSLAALAGVALWRGGVNPPGLCVAALCAALMLSPWLVRNRLVFGGWSFVRGELGLELNISNFDGASVDAEQNVGTEHFRRVHPFVSRKQCLRIREVGERQVYRERSEEALAWIGSHQAEFASLAARRWLRFWVPWSRYWWHRAGLAAVLLLAMAGWIAGGRAGIPLMLAPLGCSAAALLVHTSIRYSHPGWWALCLAAGAGAKWVRDKLISSP
ncbi:MAG: hypothetical protein HXY18_06985 [Bryobacteraceae bacterium]|nr:hypothetical protein [Bryobacteraceae bacterium]